MAALSPCITLCFILKHSLSLSLSLSLCLVCRRRVAADSVCRPRVLPVYSFDLSASFTAAREQRASSKIDTSRPSRRRSAQQQCSLRVSGILRFVCASFVVHSSCVAELPDSAWPLANGTLLLCVNSILPGNYTAQSIQISIAASAKNTLTNTRSHTKKTQNTHPKNKIVVRRFRRARLGSPFSTPFRIPTPLREDTRPQTQRRRRTMAKRKNQPLIESDSDSSGSDESGSDMDSVGHRLFSMSCVFFLQFSLIFINFLACHLHFGFVRRNSCHWRKRKRPPPTMTTTQPLRARPEPRMRPVPMSRTGAMLRKRAKPERRMRTARAKRHRENERRKRRRPHGKCSSSSSSGTVRPNRMTAIPGRGRRPVPSRATHRTTMTTMMTSVRGTALHQRLPVQRNRRRGRR